MRTCFLCGRNGCGDPLDRHHIFGGSRRNLSEKYGAVVDLCHDRCHENGPGAAHRCAQTAQLLHEYGQRKVMREQGWTVEEFRAVFGKNYLPEDSCYQTSDTYYGERQHAQIPTFSFTVTDLVMPF